MKLNYEIYRRKVRACFVGKSVGGTLGMPYEGPVQVNNVTYYDPVPNEMVPNDDLDLQVTFLEILMREGLPVSRLKLGDLWNLYNSGSLPDEYGVANANYRKMIYAPLSGVYNNAFHSGMGAAIRSELWACLAPGDPELAVRIATEDACVDHSGDGISAIRFLAAIESAAFAENDLNKLIETGMRYLPEGERMKNAFKDTIAWWNETEDYIRVREKILEKYVEDVVKRAYGNRSDLSIAKEACIAIENGAVSLHDMSQGGVYAALWDMAEASGTGLLVDFRAIAVRQEIIEICEIFDINPYELNSCGSLLITSSDSERIIKALAEEGIDACVIGKVTDGNDKIINNLDEVRFLDKPVQDEIYRLQEMQSETTAE